MDNKVLNNPAGAQTSPYQNTLPMRPYMDTMPAQYQEAPASPTPTGVSPSTFQSPLTAAPSQPGVSPSTYQTDPSMDLGMMGIPRPSRQAPGTQGTLTRTEAQDTSPFMEGPPSIMSAGYTPAYLRTIIGKRVRAEFVFQNLYLDKTGILREVGISYFVLEDNATHAMVMCDLYSVRFVTSV